MSNDNQSGPPVRTRIALLAALLGAASLIWLGAGLLELVPLRLSLPGESSIRIHAAVTVACLLVAAWGYWNE